MINQHLIVGSHEEISNYFKNKIKSYDLTINDINGCVEIPTMLIKDQLANIDTNNDPQTGFVFYLLRNVINHPDGTFGVEIGLGMEMVWIRNQNNVDYPRSIFNQILQYKSNTDIIEKLKSYATKS
jgi:hypothetical protein